MSRVNVYHFIDKIDKLVIDLVVATDSPSTTQIKYWANHLSPLQKILYLLPKRSVGLPKLIQIELHKLFI